MGGGECFSWTRLQMTSQGTDPWEIVRRLEALGAKSVEIRPALDPIFADEVSGWGAEQDFELTALFEGPVEAARAARKFLGGSSASVSRIERIRERDWVEFTRRSFVPRRFGERLWIVPAWQEPPDPQAPNVFIEPGLAFGTGNHPSTALCLEWLAGAAVTGRRIIDFGTGSGILAVTAARLGAARVLALDIEPQALEAARANARRNGVDIEVGAPDAFPEDDADLVLANILARPLLALASELLARVRPNGLLVLSGVSDAQADVVAAAYAGRARLVERLSDSGWTLLALQKAASTSFDHFSVEPGDGASLLGSRLGSMFTRCTGCGSWFRVSPEALRAVHGLVRCGECGIVFNAHGTLHDTPPESLNDRREFAEASAVAVAPRDATPGLIGRRRKAVRWPWRIAAAVLLLAGAAQLVNAARQTLADWPKVGPVVGAIYRYLGHPIEASPVLADFEIESATIVGVKRGRDALRLSGLLVNEGKRSQVLPLIDVKLMDRYGQTVATKLLTPREYGAGARSKLGPNLSFVFNVKLADPGVKAVGFALTVCKREDSVMRCRGF